MVRKQNERTLLLQYRIIPLSLPTNSILSYFSTPCPLSSRLGAFSFPRNIFPQIFSEIFSKQTKATFFCIFGAKNYVFLGRTFFCFYGAKNYGGKGHLSLPKWGGYPFLYAPYIARAFVCSLLHNIPAFPAPIVANFQTIRAKRGKNEFFLAWLGVFSGFSETEKGKNLIYF